MSDNGGAGCMATTVNKDTARCADIEAGRQAIHKGVSASGGRQWRGEDDRAVSIPDARVGNQFFTLYTHSSWSSYLATAQVMVYGLEAMNYALLLPRKENCG